MKRSPPPPEPGNLKRPWHDIQTEARLLTEALTDAEKTKRVPRQAISLEAIRLLTESGTPPRLIYLINLLLGNPLANSRRKDKPQRLWAAEFESSFPEDPEGKKPSTASISEIDRHIRDKAVRENTEDPKRRDKIAVTANRTEIGRWHDDPEYWTLVDHYRGADRVFVNADTAEKHRQRAEDELKAAKAAESTSTNDEA